MMNTSLSIRISVIFVGLLLLSACSSFVIDGAHLNKQGRTVVKAIDDYDNTKIEELKRAILSLGPDIVAK